MINEEHAKEETPPLADPILSPEEAAEKANIEEDAREESRFKDGQILRFVRVRFPGNSRSFPFLLGKRRVEYGQKVVAMSDRGMAVGYVNSFPYEVRFHRGLMPVRSISKVATEEDIVNDQKAYHQQKNAENICNKLIEQYKLDMHLTHVEFTSFGKKAIFYFIAPDRVDFRDLVRDLVARLKTRIELRQISVRDRSASIGGLGPCGRELCCSSFLTKYGNVGIKMAKNQDLTLNFSKLNGVCGQLKCCLQYEDDVYREKRSRLPREGDIVTTHTGETGRVDRLHLLSEQFVMMTTKGVRKRYVLEHYKETLSKEEANFPKEFESVSDETFKVVGLEDAEAIRIKKFEEEIKTYKDQSKAFADSTFKELFGEETLGLMAPELPELDNGKPRFVVTPDEEEEIAYTPSEDEILPDDDDDDEDDEDSVEDEAVQVIAQPREEDQPKTPQPQNRSGQGREAQGRGPQGRPSEGRPSPGRDRNAPRENRDNRDNRGRRPERSGEGRSADGNRQSQGNRPPQGNRPSQGQGNGPRERGQGQNRNQGRNRPPR